MSAAAYTAVWRPGDGAQWWNSPLPMDQFKAKDKAYFDQGLRLVALRTHAGKYMGVWRPGSGAQWWNPPLTLDAFKAKDKAYFDQGLRLVALNIDEGEYSGVWRPGSGAQWWNSPVPVDQFKAKDKTYFDQGLRLVTLIVRGGKYTGVWRPGSGAQWWNPGVPLEEFKAKDKAYFDQGLRLVALSIDGGKYTGVWRPGEGAQWWSSMRGIVDFKTEDSGYFARGLRIASLELQDDPVGAYRYPWKGGVSYTVGQGNNNPSGSHNGSQAWAFDFNMPAGTTIRVARGGTVEWLQENLTATYNPNLPTGPGNTPFPAGSLQNWGNAVRRRHAGGFTSWYFHIQANGVLVKVDDEVTQGQVIALSGNTGRSSGPHLHFQVQADSTNWGQSVAHTFGADCEQPVTGATVMSDGAT